MEVFKRRVSGNIQDARRIVQKLEIVLPKARQRQTILTSVLCLLISDAVGEHCSCLRRRTERSAGGPARAYVDTSSDNEGEKPSRRKPQVSCSQVNLLRVSRLLRRGREA